MNILYEQQQMFFIYKLNICMEIGVDKKLQVWILYYNLVYFINKIVNKK